jgi:hypothetical protein
MTVKVESGQEAIEWTEALRAKAVAGMIFWPCAKRFDPRGRLFDAPLRRLFGL